MNRIGRRTAYAMLVILALAIVWQVLGSLQTSPKETVPGAGRQRDRFLSLSAHQSASLFRGKSWQQRRRKRATTWDTLSARCPDRPMSCRSLSAHAWERAAVERVQTKCRAPPPGAWNDGSSPPPAGAVSLRNEKPGNRPGSSGVFPPRRNAYFAPAEMSIAAVLKREN